MSAVTSIYFNGKTLRSVTVKRVQYWPMRDLGVVLGYTSRGGNLSRQVHHGFCDALREGVDYIMAPRPKRGGQRMFLLTRQGVDHVLRLIVRHDRHRRVVAADFRTNYWRHTFPKPVALKARVDALEKRVLELEAELRKLRPSSSRKPVQLALDLLS